MRKLIYSFLVRNVLKLKNFMPVQKQTQKINTILTVTAGSVRQEDLGASHFVPQLWVYAVADVSLALHRLKLPLQRALGAEHAQTRLPHLLNQLVHTWFQIQA